MTEKSKSYKITARKEEVNKTLETPYYLIDEKRLLKNLKVIEDVKKRAGVKVVLALKCFSAWSVFGLMKNYFDGTTSSSPYEARLGFEKFGKEVHAYSVAYSKEDIKEVRPIADKIIFNSVSQLRRFHRASRGVKLGLRVNPGVSHSRFDLANPARRFSRLGVLNKKLILDVLPLLSGVMFHYNCENDDFDNFASHLDALASRYADILRQMEWVSLGGGFYFTKEGYPVGKFCEKLKSFGQRFKVQVYLEPGESAITESTQLVTRVLDIVHNEVDIAIVDASTEAHMLDLLIYRQSAKVQTDGKFEYMVAGRSCLAGDAFGVYGFPAPLRVGSIIRFRDAAGYTMVKKNWFNGLKMPSIVVKRLNGSLDVVRRFTYADFAGALS